MIAIVAALLVFLEPLRFAAEALAVVPTIRIGARWRSSN